MFTVNLSTLVAVSLVFLFIIALLLISKTKPSKSQTEEMQQTGWEIVEEIKSHITTMDAKLEEMRALEGRMKEMEEAAKARALLAKKEKQMSAEPSPNDPHHKQQIIELHREGKTIDEIVAILGEAKGVVEVVVNFEKMKKHA